ncbi:nucleoporin 62 like [Megalops cyprinoides]|uniref:nucleoporin 62 like n=1 Tax=Megalops cyprinoides TaxID=118141 RepID=UPI001864AE15|nr:nucleoporin 62 like [Megalops cyprinoides]
MSGFNFGAPGGFNFGTPKTTAGAAPASGFGISSSTSSAGSGFTFGTPNQAQPPAAANQTSGLFSGPAQGNTGNTGGFSFGNTAQTSASGGGFSFGNTASKLSLNTPATSQPASTGLTLGTATPSSGTGFSLGGALGTQTTMAPAGGGFTFGTGGTLGTATAQIQAQPAAGAATAGFTLGGAPASQASGGFSFGAKVQTAAITTAAPTSAAGGGFSFGTSTAAAPAQPTATLTLGGQSTGLTLSAVTPASTTAAAPGATTQGAGFSFGIKPAATPAPATTAPPSQAVPAAASSLFTAPAAATAASTAATGFTLGAATTAAAPATTSAGGGALGFMLKPLGAATTSTATTAAATTGTATAFALGTKPAGPTATGTTAPITGTATSTTAAAASAPPVMSYAQLEALINKWSLELEDQERHFLQQATQVNAWDRMLVENGEKITSLHREMEKVKLDQRRLDQELDFILSQQKELEDLLSPLEESVKEQSGTIYMQNADEERERTYKLAENVDAQLKRMSQDLKEIIEHLNTSSGSADTSDPLQQICKILNAHMDSLQWIDQNSLLLQRRVEEVSKLCDNRRKEQEKSFRITFE